MFSTSYSNNAGEAFNSCTQRGDIGRPIAYASQAQKSAEHDKWLDSNISRIEKLISGESPTKLTFAVATRDYINHFEYVVSTIEEADAIREQLRLKHDFLFIKDALDEEYTLRASLVVGIKCEPVNVMEIREGITRLKEQYTK